MSLHDGLLRGSLLWCVSYISAFRKRPELGVGDWRWYMTPKGLIKDSWELPTGWGLLEVCGKVVRVKREPTEMKKNHNAETNILWSAVRRLQIGKDAYSKPIR